MSTLSDLIQVHLPARRKVTPSGWTSFNSVCCHHRGHSQDTRGRGGYIVERDVVSYSCFNCGYKASWQPGRQMSGHMRRLLQWLGVSDTLITKCAFDILKTNADHIGDGIGVEFPTFKEAQLPPNSQPIVSVTDSNITPVLEYIVERDLDLADTTYYWSSDRNWQDRLIIPFYHSSILVGYTARTSNPNRKPKYLTSSQPGYVFNIDNQPWNRQYAILTEGPVDALHVGGISVLGSEIADNQLMLIKSLQRDIIVVPDRDKKGKGLVDYAIEQGWLVSMPPWDKEINDIGDAVTKYGRTLTLYTIMKYKLQNKLKIQLGAKKWFG